LACKTIIEFSKLKNENQKNPNFAKTWPTTLESTLQPNHHSNISNMLLSNTQYIAHMENFTEYRTIL
jgi:hypothetical protein